MDVQNLILKKIGWDKLLHFSFGGWFACFAPFEMWYMAIIIAFSIGLIKELFDVLIRKSKFDISDWLATTLGGVASAIMILGWNLIKQL